jgi:streptogramin lyase
MRTTQHLLICIMLLATNLAAQSPQVDLTRINAMAQDSTGTVWGIARAANSDLFQWKGDKWGPVAPGGVPENSRPAALASGPDGAVYCLWNAAEHEHTVTWHSGTVTKTLARFSGDLADIAYIFVDPKKNVWITERGVHIYRISPQGKAECVYTIEYDRRYESNLPPGGRMNFDSVFAMADGQGSIWFWSGGPQGGGIPALNGILIFDGKNFDLHTNFPGPPLKRYFAVEPDGADHMWIAGARDHLYRVSTRTLAAEVVPDPESNAFRFVQKIFHAGRATYIITAEGSMPVPERSGEGRIGILWQQQGGEWKRVVNGLDMRSAHLTDPLRSFATTPAGLWLGAYGTGPWLIPAGPGEPVHIDWRYGFPLEESEGLMALPDGRLLVVAASTGSMALKPADLLNAFQPPTNVRTLNPLRLLVADRQNHLWGFLSGDRKVISEWDGKTWADHALPESFDTMRFWSFGIDTQDRIWLLHAGCQGSASILTPATEKLETFRDYSVALQTQISNHSSFLVHGERFTTPAVTPDGRIAYRDDCGQAHYFNGEVWQAWRAQEIDPGRRGPFDGPPFFDQAGNFATNITGRTWEYTPTQGWRTTNYEPGTGNDRERSASAAPKAPPGCEVHNPESAAKDRLGTYWFTSQGQLYRAIPGMCVRQFSPQQRQPFVDFRTVKSVVIDPEGNAFLETYFHNHSNFGEYVIVNARPHLSPTKVHPTIEATGSVKLKIETHLTGKVWFTWRVDGGDWATPTESAQANVNWLTEGKHMIEAAALDDRLQIDPTPANIEVTIHVDPQAQIAALIDQLKDPDYAMRDAAVAALVRQPTLALPLLQSARATTGEDQRWWIDAAIQQIKDRPAKGKQP